MPTVFVSQLPHKKDPITGIYVPGYNIDPATAHGAIRILVPPKAPYTDSDQLMPQLAKTFDYNFQKGDSLLLLGDPVVTAMIVLMAGKKGPVRILRWDRNIGAYTPVVVRHHNKKLAA